MSSETKKYCIFVTVYNTTYVFLALSEKYACIMYMQREASICAFLFAFSEETL